MTTIKIHGQKVPESLKKMEFEVADNEVVGSLLEKIVKKHPELHEILLSGPVLRTDIGILINGRHCMFMDGLRTKVAPYDTVDIIMPVIGG